MSKWLRGWHSGRGRKWSWKALLRSLHVAMLAAVALPAYGQTANFTYKRTTADAVNYNYCVVRGQLQNPFGSAIQGAGLLTTSGASRNIVGSAAGGFSNFPTPSATRGVIINVSTDGGNTYIPYRVATVTDATHIVLDTSEPTVNWASPGFAWSWYDEICGTTDTTGWIPCSEGSNLTFQYDSGAGNANVIWQAKGSALGSAPVQIYPDNSAGAASRLYAASGADSRTTFALGAGVRFSLCRIGIKANGPVVSAYIDKLK